MATYGEAPSRRRLMRLLGDDAASPDSTERMRSVPDSMLRQALPGAASGVNGAMSTNQPVASTYTPPGSPGGLPRSAVTYRPSTELTSSSAAELPPTARTGPRPAVMVAIGVFAFAFAFAVGIAVHGWQGRASGAGVAPSQPPPPVSTGLVVPPPPVASASAAALSAASDAPSPSAVPSAAASTATPEEIPSAYPARHHRRHEPSASGDKPSAPAATDPSTPEPPKVDCTVTLDADGNKKWKMECVGH